VTSGGALAGDGEALVRPLAVARCDIDRFLASGLFPLRGPFALGHECVGEIAALRRRGARAPRSANAWWCRSR